MLDWWTWPLDGWIVAAGVLCALSCALLGNFMVLRRMSMMGDAISHAVLPGLALAFIITSSRDPLTMLAGAAVVGVLTALLTQGIARLGNVEESASMGVVFTSLFALGLILIRQAADHVDLDPGCVLYGNIETVWFDKVRFGMAIPRVVLVLGVMFLVNAAFVALFYKELKITSFDPDLATTLGINANVMHYLLMTLVAATTVASFEAVGSILVVAMLIVPPAAAHLLTDRMGVMILLSLLIGAVSGIFGHIAAVEVPGWFGYGATNTAGMMAGMTGLIFLGVLLFAPRHGIVSKLAHRVALSIRIVGEDVLGLLYRAEERAGQASLPAAQLRQALKEPRMITTLAMLWLRRRGQLATSAAGLSLTETGRRQAHNLLRSHRLWESYLVQQADVCLNQSHALATHLEHVTDRSLQRRLGDAIQHQPLDPHGTPIPPAQNGSISE